MQHIIIRIFPIVDLDANKTDLIQSVIVDIGDFSIQDVKIRGKYYGSRIKDIVKYILA